MASKGTSTERRRWPLRRAAALVPVFVAIGSVALAHGPERRVEREIVRLQGYRETRPQGVEVSGEIVLGVLGVDHRFHLTARQVLGNEAAAQTLPARLLLQGDREMLARIAAARAEQRVTILGERRSGAVDLFLLAADFCPEK